MMLKIMDANICLNCRFFQLIWVESNKENKEGKWMPKCNRKDCDNFITKKK
jgi:hypothetical protein